jgi:hypothetical protein
MRSTRALAGLAGVLALAASAVPAHASGGHVTMRCTLSYSTLIGTGPGNGNCTATGVVNGTVVANAPASLSFTASNTCPLQSAAGTEAGPGALTFTFQWQRVGTSGTVTSTGGINGAGSVEFSSPCPANGETAVFSVSGT